MGKGFISFLKILTSVLFLFIVVSDSKLSLIMGLLLLLGLFGSGILGFLYSASALIAALYLLSSGAAHNTSKRDRALSILSILILYIPVGYTISTSFKHATYLVSITYGLFIATSVATLVFLIKGIFRDKYLNQSKVG